MDKKEKSYIVGFLLDSMKFIDKEECQLANAGINYTSLGTLSNNLWINIKYLTGMPLIEEEGKFISDYWFDIVVDFIEGRCKKEVAVKRLLDWESDFKD